MTTDGGHHVLYLGQHSAKVRGQVVGMCVRLHHAYILAGCQGHQRSRGQGRLRVSVVVLLFDEALLLYHELVFY